MAGVVLASLLSMRGAAPLSEAAAQASGLGTPLDSSGGGSGEAHAGTHELSAAAHGARVESARAVLSAVAAFGLEDCWQWKPLLDGKQVGGRAVGWVGRVLKKCEGCWQWKPWLEGKQAGGWAGWLVAGWLAGCLADSAELAGWFGGMGVGEAEGLLAGGAFSRRKSGGSLFWAESRWTNSVQVFEPPSALWLLLEERDGY
eukprot:353231-Chlamydomonas_euryale.AAC.6